MTTDQKLIHARCMANAARHYLNSAYADLDGQYHVDGKGNPDTVPQKVVYSIISHCDALQFELSAIVHAQERTS